MVLVVKRYFAACAAVAVSLLGGQALAAPVPAQTALSGSSEAPGVARPASSGLGQAAGMIVLDYQVIPVPASQSIDLLGFHVYNKLNDWLYLGVGGLAPLFKGEYGGFMAFDVAAHAQRRLFGRLFADAGLALGGGGGGKTVQQSKVLSGTGGFVKGYVGLGYDFDGFAVGANIARMKFVDSAINHSQLNVYVQVPFSYAIGPYSRSGEPLVVDDRSAAQGANAAAGESTLTFGLDNLVQINPKGSNKNNINTVDLQFSHFLTPSSYWFFNAAAGYHGRPLYNQAFGGVGYRVRMSPRVNLYSQLGVGSGGYAPETIDTGPGLLVYPRISAEYMINRNLGASLSAGYLFAPKGSSKNYTVGAALNYHLRAGDGGSGAGDEADRALLRGYRLNVFQQTESKVVTRGSDQPNIRLISTQLDNVVGRYLYIPIQVSVAYNAYLSYPGYGEILAGVGVQNAYQRSDRFQFFGQVLAGANVHGAIVKTGVGMNVGLSDRWALYGVAGQTLAGLGSRQDKFRSDYIGAGLTYRFSVPSR